MSDLTEAFRDGVDEREDARLFVPRPPPCARYTAPMPWCFLGQHDPRQRPCVGQIERFHFIPRQRVELAIWQALRTVVLPGEGIEIMDVAAWDPRNGGIACEGHHRRYDSHLTPELRINADVVPLHVVEFTTDYGLELEFERRFVGAEVMRDWTLVV
jgi:hypothetical protein